MTSDLEPSEYFAEAVGLVSRERVHQLRLKAEGRFDYTASDIEVSETLKLLMIQEEVGEVARNIMARAGIVTDGDPTTEALVKELVQVAALSLAFVEGLLKRSSQLVDKHGKV